MEYWLGDNSYNLQRLLDIMVSKLTDCGGELMAELTGKIYKSVQNKRISPRMIFIASGNLALRFLDDETTGSHIYSFWCHYLNIDNSLYRDISREFSLWERYVWKDINFCIPHEDLKSTTPFEIAQNIK